MARVNASDKANNLGINLFRENWLHNRRMPLSASLSLPIIQMATFGRLAYQREEVALSSCRLDAVFICLGKHV